LKLLFDQNLSPKLVNRLTDLFPGSSHVHSVGLDCASDDQVWEHARLNGFAIVTKDEDYNNLSVVRGSPPKVLWLQLGNCTTAHVEAVFRARLADIEAFERDPSVGTLVLS
jgi:predicted nuclease of predicted toxin-antitoxin system